SGAISSLSSKSPYFLSVISIPPLPEPGGSCSPVSTPSSTCQLPPVPCPIFSRFVCHPARLWPSNRSVYPRPADPAARLERHPGDSNSRAGAEYLKKSLLDNPSFDIML